MSANGQVVALTPAEQLRDRLDAPAIAASLNSLLDHADLLAILVTGLDGLVRRGEQISESVASAVDEIRGASFTASLPGIDEGSVDMQALVASLASLASALVAATPALDKILHSPLVDPQAAEVLTELGQALVEGRAAAAADPGGPKGLFSLWRLGKDRDINRGLGFLVQVARAFGRQLPK